MHLSSNIRYCIFFGDIHLEPKYNNNNNNNKYSTNNLL